MPLIDFLRQIPSQHPSKPSLLKDEIYTPQAGTQPRHPDSEVENENPSGAK